MSCDISQLFTSIIRTIRSAKDGTKPIELESPMAATVAPQNEFSFANRARGLRSNLLILSGYLKRIHQLTAATIGNRSKQRVYADLTEQVANLIDQCTVLLAQLHDVATIDDSGFDSNNHKSQLNMHRLAVYKSLHEELGKLKKIRDVEINRQRHFLELTGTLASGVKNINLTKGQNNVRFDELEIDVRKRSQPNKTKADSRGGGNQRIENQTDSVTRKPELEFSDAELQTLEMENSQLLSHLDREREDVHHVARSITEIGRLNQTISEHLVMQLEQTEQIAEQTVSATENIRLANEQLREAINRKGSLKSCLLFILIVLTFSLHFLDWYYP